MLSRSTRNRSEDPRNAILGSTEMPTASCATAHSGVRSTPLTNGYRDVASYATEGCAMERSSGRPMEQSYVSQVGTTWWQAMMARRCVLGRERYRSMR